MFNMLMHVHHAALGGIGWTIAFWWGSFDNLPTGPFTWW